MTTFTARVYAFERLRGSTNENPRWSVEVAHGRYSYAYPIKVGANFLRTMPEFSQGEHSITVNEKLQIIDMKRVTS